MPHNITLVSPDDLHHITDIATRTWKVAYKDILSTEQVSYMLEEMYAPAVLLHRLEKGNLFYLIYDEQEVPMGFAEVELDINGPEAKLHKIYVLPEAQGKHIGLQLLDHIKSIAATNAQHALLLNVNRYNPALHFYQKHGFTVLREEDIDIGNGYYMNDYVMQYLF